MSEWEVLTLEQAGVTLLDCDHKTPAAREAGRPYIGIPQMTTGRVVFETARKISEEDYFHWTRKTKYQTDDVILSRRTNPGVTAVDDTGTDFALGQNLVLLRADGSRVRPDFLRWMVHTPQWWEQIDKYLNVGAVFSSLKCRDVPKFELTVPPIAEQLKVNSILRPIADKIELNRRMNETSEEMARALFRDWFVDFGPTRRQMEGATDPAAIMGHAFPPEKAATLAPLFPAKLGDDGMPEGWEMGEVSDLADLNPKSWTAKKHPDVVEYVDLSNTKWGRIEETTNYDWSDAPSRARRVLETGDTIVGTVRPGNGSYSLIGKNGLTGSTGFAVLRPKHSNAKEFVYCALTSPENIEKLANLADGGAYPAINPKVVVATKIAREGGAAINGFSEVTQSMFAKRHANEQENQTLASLRDLLLPKLMSGEIRLKDAEAV